MIDLARLLADLPPRPDPERLVAGFVPPPRFAGKRFAAYVPDCHFPSQAQALERLRAHADALRGAEGGWARLRARVAGRPRGRGLYLDGGFGVGKTHLLAALWNAAPSPSAYLSFDELVYTLGLLGVDGARAAFRELRLVAVDEWELDDPGNLKLAIAFLRGALADGVHVAATSNTVPDELGRGRFDQKSFRAEVEELAASFDVLRIEGEDYRHRRFAADPDRTYFLTPDAFAARLASAGERSLRATFPELLDAIASVHPIHYHALAAAMGELLLTGLRPLANLYEGLRWVHFVDKVYDGNVPLAATAELGLGELFPGGWMRGPFGKKFSRCLSRMEEMLGEARARAGG